MQMQYWQHPSPSGSITTSWNGYSATYRDMSRLLQQSPLTKGDLTPSVSHRQDSEIAGCVKPRPYTGLAVEKGLLSLSPAAYSQVIQYNRDHP